MTAELQKLKLRLHQIHDSIPNFKPLISKPPIVDSPFGVDGDDDGDQWFHQSREPIPGLEKLQSNIKLDLIVLEKFLDDPNCDNLPPPSANAPYVIAVWNELLCARGPVISVLRNYFPHSVPLRAKGQQKPSASAAVKVDVVADNGRQWIRINTAKNSRLLSEFCELDSYWTDSEDDTTSTNASSTQKGFDNSVLRMGRSLVEAASNNCIKGTNVIPQVVMRLTRLDPDKSTDPRIGQTIQQLRDMGIVVQLGERSDEELPPVHTSSSDRADDPPLLPTLNINLDLSMLIAVISDLTHSSLPTTIEEANKRFIPPPEYREWKKKRQEKSGKPPRKSRHKLTREVPAGQEEHINELPHDLIKHSRALTNQLLQEMAHPMMQEVHDRLEEARNEIADNTPSASADEPKIVFWTTPEARDRCLRIVSKIGGALEKQRARALFCLPATATTTPPPSETNEEEIPLEEAQRIFWKDSRFPINYLPIQPIQLYPTTPPQVFTDPSHPPNPTSDPPPPKHAVLRANLETDKPLFFKNLDTTCAHILSQDIIPHPRAARAPEEERDEIRRASVTKANPRLTAHTVQSMQWGAQLGWTTLTANRSSVKAMMREVREQGLMGWLGAVRGDPITSTATALEGLSGEEVVAAAGGSPHAEARGKIAIWIMSPRSLAEGMSGGSG